MKKKIAVFVKSLTCGDVSKQAVMMAKALTGDYEMHLNGMKFTKYFVIAT